MITRYVVDSRNDWRPTEDAAGGWVLWADVHKMLQELRARWSAAELNMRVLHGGLPGSGYDKLADGYGTCMDELSDAFQLTQPGAAGQE